MKNDVNEQFGACRMGGEPARHMNIQYKAWGSGLQLPVLVRGDHFAVFFLVSSWARTTRPPDTSPIVTWPGSSKASWSLRVKGRS